MATLKITRGYPASFFTKLKTGGTTVSLDNTWSVVARLRYQTATGEDIPFGLGCTQSLAGVLISLTADQTKQLKTSGTGYVLVLKFAKLDSSVIVTNTIQVKVVDGII